MVSRLRYRLASVTGAGLLTVVALFVANDGGVQQLSMVIPVYNNLHVTTLGNGVLTVVLATVLVVQLLALLPLFKPRPRRILDTVMSTQRRVLLATFVLATVGYFDYTYRLPRTTLVLTTAFSLLVLPMWFVAIRHRRTRDEQLLVVGDDPARISVCVNAADEDVVGYVAPNWLLRDDPPAQSPAKTEITADGGVRGDGGVRRDGGLPAPAASGEQGRLGGLSRFDAIISEYDVDGAVLAFARPDRGEFFGALDTCYENGVTALVHTDHVDSVLTAHEEGGELVRVMLSPLDWQDKLIKRGFDVVFAGPAMLALAPLVVVLALAVTLDSDGPVFYRQERTAARGDTFTVYKFRTMETGDASEMPGTDDDNDRITRVGRVLRRTHFDEIPQLWSILTGHMSVVGPRAAWIDEESVLEAETTEWRKRWFVKPGLTGLAQINDASSTEPRRKLQYDLRYIREQSFWFDLKILIRQLWLVGEDVLGMLTASPGHSQ